MLRTLLCLLPALLVGALAAQAPAAGAPAAAEAGKVVIVVRSHAPVFRHVGSRTRRYVVPADHVLAEQASRRANQRRPEASLRHLKGR